MRCILFLARFQLQSVSAELTPARPATYPCRRPKAHHQTPVCLHDDLSLHELRRSGHGTVIVTVVRRRCAFGCVGTSNPCLWPQVHPKTSEDEQKRSEFHMAYRLCNAKLAVESGTLAGSTPCTVLTPRRCPSP